MNQVSNRTVKEWRKLKGLTQNEIAEKVNLNRTTYAYKEETGSFTDYEKQAIAKALKADMTTISWNRPIFQAKTTEDALIRQQKETIMKLEAEIKTLKEMIDKLLQNR